MEHIIRIGLGSYFCYLTYYFFVDDIFLLSLFPLLLAFACFYTYFGDFITTSFANFYFSNRGGDKSLEQFSHVQGLLANRKYEEAVQELKLIIASNPTAVAGKVLLVNTLYEHLGRSNEALNVSLKEFEADKWCEDHEKIVMTAVDIFLEKGERKMAVALLRTAVLKLKKYPVKNGVERRLRSLESKR